MIEDDIGYVFGRAVGRDGHHGHRDGDVIRGSVQQQKSVYGALHQHARILLDQLLFPVVAGGEVEVVSAGQLLNYAAHHPGEIALAQVGRQHAYAHGAALPRERAK